MIWKERLQFDFQCLWTHHRNRAIDPLSSQLLPSKTIGELKANNVTPRNFSHRTLTIFFVDVFFNIVKHLKLSECSSLCFIPKGSIVAETIVFDAHIVSVHNGRQQVMWNNRQDFWVDSLTRMTIKAISQCSIR